MANWRRIVETALKTISSEIYWDEPLCRHTTFRIGGKAECYIVVANLKDLKSIIKLSRNNHIPIFVIGNGSNLLISDQGLLGITIKLGEKFSYINRNGTQLNIGSATHLSYLLKFIETQSLSGIEFLWGIPATFGGAVVSNAGAFGQNIGSKIDYIKGINLDGDEIILNREQLQFSYRKTILPDNFIVLEGTVNLITATRSNIMEKIKEYKGKRQKTQPAGFSAGSVFKNPSLQPAGKLIDDCQLKGIKNNKAFISRVHGNFIINDGDAKFCDVYELIQFVKSNIELKNNIMLTEEIQILPKNQEVKKWQSQEKF